MKRRDDALADLNITTMTSSFDFDFDVMAKFLGWFREYF